MNDQVKSLRRTFRKRIIHSIGQAPLRRVSIAFKRIIATITAKRSTDVIASGCSVKDSVLSLNHIYSAISNAMFYIEKNIEEGNETNVNRLYHPQHVNVNSSRQQQVRLCTKMIREGNHRRKSCIRVDEFGIFSDIHVISEAIKNVLRDYASSNPQSLYDNLRNMLKKSGDDDVDMFFSKKIQRWKGYDLFIRCFIHISKLCSTDFDLSQRNDDGILAHVFAQVFFPALKKNELKQIIRPLIQVMKKMKVSEASSSNDNADYSNHGLLCHLIRKNEAHPNTYQPHLASLLTSPSDSSERTMLDDSRDVLIDPRIVASYKRHFKIITTAKEQLLAAHSLLKRFDYADPKLAVLKLI